MLSFALLPVMLLSAETVWIQKTDGSRVEGKTDTKSISFGGKPVALAQILSLHTGAPATDAEKARITAAIAEVQGTDRAKRDQAVEDLTVYGVAAITPLLEAYKDTDQHEPRPLYRLFERVIPSNADGFNREQSLLRRKGGAMERGVVSGDATIVVEGQSVSLKDIRLLAVRQKVVDRTAVPVHSLKHSTQIEYLDSGILLSPTSMLDVTATGFARLSFKEDGWASDPNGLTKPGSPAYKSHLWDGQPFGALVARIGSSGEVFFLGKQHHKAAPKAGRLQLAINDNRHWQNNLGTYTVTIRATDAYDAGAPQ
jgi:hypothetical protein